VSYREKRRIRTRVFRKEGAVDRSVVAIARDGAQVVATGSLRVSLPSARCVRNATMINATPTAVLSGLAAMVGSDSAISRLARRRSPTSKRFDVDANGEGALPPTSAALANAFVHATGRRLRELPMTPERVKASLS
jgi:hypothetical protein